MPDDKASDNIIPFEPRPKPDRPQKQNAHPPMFNIPPATKILTGLILFVYLVIFGLSITFIPNAETITVAFGGFVPASWTTPELFNWQTVLTVFTFSFLHGGWLHLGFNTVLLVAMGSGLEKSVGIKRYFYIYIGSTVFALLTHMALYPFSIIPLIGASGGINGVFGAMIYLMHKNQTAHTSKLIPMIAVYIGITALIGLIGGPDGASVAWVAHIGGFLAGIGIMMLLLKHQK